MQDSMLFKNKLHATVEINSNLIILSCLQYIKLTKNI